MKTKAIIVILSLFIFSSCSRDRLRNFHPLQKPIDIEAFNSGFNYKGNSIQVIAILDQARQSIVLLEATSDKDYLNFESSGKAPITIIPVDGTPKAMALEETASGEKRIWYVESENNRMFGIKLIEGANPDYEYIEIGSSRSGFSSKFIFRNLDGSRLEEALNRYPSMSDENVNASSVCQTWWGQYDSKKDSFSMNSSLTGNQSNRLYENTLFISDDASLEFILNESSNPIRNKNTISFSSCSASYIQLNVLAKDIHIDSDLAQAFVVGNSDIEIIDTNAYVSLALVTEASALEFKKSKHIGTEIMIPDSGNQVFVFDTLAQSFSALAVPSEVEDLSLVNGQLLMIANNQQSFYFDRAASTASQFLDFNYLLNGVISSDVNGTNLSYVFTKNGEIFIINDDTQAKVDMVVRKNVETQSFWSGGDFFDQANPSRPIFLGVKTLDGVSTQEDWLLTYEGSVSGAFAQACTVSGTIVTSSGFDFSTSNVQVGDSVVFSDGISQQNANIVSIDSPSQITVDQTISLAATEFSVFANASYILSGSRSGEQINRVFENQAYTSDNGAVRLTVQSDPIDTTDRFDFFSFKTFDGVESMSFGRNANFYRSQIVDAVSLFNLKNDRNEIYFIQQNDGRILVVNADNVSMIDDIN